MQRQSRTILLLILLVAAIPPQVARVEASPRLQSEAESACIKGVQLFREGQAAQALPLLEAGFSGRAEASFADRNDLGLCAVALGRLRNLSGDQGGALDALDVALGVFQETGNRQFEGVTLSNIAQVYDARGPYEQALEFHQRALAVFRELGDEGTVALELTKIGITYSAQGQYEEALAADNEALAIARERGFEDEEALALNNIGEVYRKQGRYSAALEIFQKALTIEQRTGDRQDEGTVLHNMGLVYFSQGRYVEAQRNFEQALGRAREAGDRDGEGSTLLIIGQVSAAQGRNREALDYYQQALTIFREIGNTQGEATALNNIAHVYELQGRYEESLAAFQQVLRLARQLGNRLLEGVALNNIGTIYEGQGRYDEALDSHEQALGILEELGDQHNVAATLGNEAVIYDRQGRTEEALAIHEKALTLQRSLGDRDGEAITLHNVGTIHYANRHFDEALKTFEQALEIVREARNRNAEAHILNAIGGIYEEQGRYDEALRIGNESLEISRELGDPVSEGVALHNLGFLHQEQGQADKALDFYTRAIDILETVRVSAGTEAGRGGFIARYSVLYERAVSLYHQQGQDAEAFYISERGRARAFLDSLATGAVELTDATAAARLEREREADAGRRAALTALTRAQLLDPPDPELISELKGQLTAAEAEHASALEAIESRRDELSAFVPGTSPVLVLTAVQKLLDEQTTLVSYYLNADKGAIAFVITQDQLTVIELPEATPGTLGALVESVAVWRNADNPHPLPLRSLHSILVAPLAAHLLTPVVGIIPHRQLHYVPFAALSDGQSYLGEQHTLFMLPSASALAFIRANAANAVSSKRDGAVVFGNPLAGQPELPPLAHAAAEADSIAKLLRTRSYTGVDASEARLRSEAGGASIIHLAAHGIYNSVNPLYSAIVLAPGQQEDGRLEVREVYGLALNGSDLLVLSACETNVGELSAGDEVVGLTRAFFFAGTPTVISSLWSVDDAATEKLMVAFYRHWQRGLSKAEALQAAQAEVRVDYPSPFYWAGFVLSGDPGPSSDVASPSEDAAPAATSIPTSSLATKEAEREDGVSLPRLVGGGAAGLAILVLVLLAIRAIARRRRYS